MIKQKTDKQGFTFPFAKWMRQALKPQVTELLHSGSGSGLVDQAAVEANWSAFQFGEVHWSRAWLLLLPGTILAAPTKVVIIYMRARGELALPIRAEVVGLALTIVLNSMLTPRFGSACAAIASNCSYGGLSLFLCYYFMRQSHSGPSGLLRLRLKDVQHVIALVTQLRKKSPA